MATLDSDVPMVPVGEASSSSAPSSSPKKPKRFEIKKWSAVALWAWDIVVDNCAICRNDIMTYALNAKPTKQAPPVRNALLHGENKEKKTCGKSTEVTAFDDGGE